MKRLLLASFVFWFVWVTPLLAAEDISSVLVPPQSPAIPVVSAAAEGSHVLKASPGALLSVYAYNSGAAGFLMVFNATALPSNGTVTPIECVPIGSSSYVSLNFAPRPPEWYSTGIVAAISTTGCFTLTAGSGAFFHAFVQ
jgi:hypothetical protein